jgi:hypothetical protein
MQLNTLHPTTFIFTFRYAKKIQILQPAQKPSTKHAQAAKTCFY